MIPDSDYFPTRLALTVLTIGVVILGLIHQSGVVDGLAPQAVGTPGLVQSYPVPSGQPEQVLLDSIASGVAGKPVRVSCSLGGGGEVLGQTTVGGTVIELTGTVCGSLLYYQRDLTGDEYECVTKAQGLCQGAINSALLSMQALAHEAYHTSGTVDESTTDCYALQATAYVASRLRDDAAFSQAASRYYATNYDELRFAPAEYRLSDDCRDGANLDLRPQSAAWPG
jgi:hypothetical protein